MSNQLNAFEQAKRESYLRMRENFYKGYKESFAKKMNASKPTFEDISILIKTDK
jgi:hypothetical protein